MVNYLKSDVEIYLFFKTLPKEQQTAIKLRYGNDLGVWYAEELKVVSIFGVDTSTDHFRENHSELMVSFFLSDASQCPIMLASRLNPAAILMISEAISFVV